MTICAPAQPVRRRTRPIPWWNPQTTGAEASFVREVLESHYLNEGEFTERFEQRIAKRTGAAHAIATTSGTAALFLALAALGIGPGDEVIVPDMTFIATANAVTLTGAKPVLADVDPATLCLSPEAFEAAITPRTRAVMPVHVSGHSGTLLEVLKIARKRGLFVVEDAAEALGSSRNGRALGTFGDAGCLSFSPNKAITTGQGGMVLTNDSALAGLVRQLKDQGRPVRGTGGDDIHPAVGYNFKLTNLQAAAGLGQLTALDARLARQKRIHEIYAESLVDLPGFNLPGFDLEEGETPLWTDVVVERRDALDRFLCERQMHCRRFWFPLHTQAPYRRPDGDFPNSCRIGPQALWLPSAFTLTDEDVIEVCGAIREFFGT